MKRFILILAVAVMLWGNSNATTYNWLTNGERLSYKVSWGWFKIGDAELLYKSLPENSYQIMARAWTDSSMLKMRERLSVTGEHLEKNTPQFLPSVYQQTQLENDFKANKTVAFDHEAEQATYDNKLDRVEPDLFNIAPTARDMLSALYYLRQVANLDGKIDILPVVSLHRKYDMNVKIGKAKKMKFGHKKIMVRKISPSFISPSGNAKVKENWTIWITDDEKRLPVKIYMASKFGTFKAKLRDYGDISKESKAPKSVPEVGDLF